MEKSRSCSIIGLLSKRSSLILEDQKEYYKLLKFCILELIRLIEEDCAVHFIVCLEYDLSLSIAEMILELKSRRPGLTLECVIPYETISDKWTIRKRDRYFSIMEQCDIETMLLTSYRRDYKARCNHYLIHQSQSVLLIDVEAADRADKVIKKIDETKSISRISLPLAGSSDYTLRNSSHTSYIE